MFYACAKLDFREKLSYKYFKEIILIKTSQLGYYETEPGSHHAQVVENFLKN